MHRIYVSLMLGAFVLTFIGLIATGRNFTKELPLLLGGAFTSAVGASGLVLAYVCWQGDGSGQSILGAMFFGVWSLVAILYGLVLQNCFIIYDDRTDVNLSLGPAITVMSTGLIILLSGICGIDSPVAREVLLAAGGLLALYFCVGPIQRSIEHNESVLIGVPVGLVKVLIPLVGAVVFIIAAIITSPRKDKYESEVDALVKNLFWLALLSGFAYVGNFILSAFVNGDEVREARRSMPEESPSSPPPLPLATTPAASSVSFGAIATRGVLVIVAIALVAFVLGAFHPSAKRVEASGTASYDKMPVTRMQPEGPVSYPAPPPPTEASGSTVERLLAAADSSSEHILNLADSLRPTVHRHRSAAARAKNDEGLAKFHAGEYHEATEFFRAAAEMDPEDAEIINNVAYAELTSGHAARQTADALARAITLSPSRAYAWRDYAYYLALNNESGEKVRRALTLALSFAKNKALLLNGLEELAAAGGSNGGVEDLINETRANITAYKDAPPLAAD